MARTGWVYAGGDEDGEVERSEEDNIMEAEIGDFVHDDIYGRVQLVAGLSGGDLTVRLPDGEVKRRTCGHVRVIPPDDADQPDVVQELQHLETQAPEEVEAEAANATEQLEQAEVDGGGIEKPGAVEEAATELAKTTEGGGGDIFEKVTCAMQAQCSLVGLDTEGCDLNFYKSVVSIAPHRTLRVCSCVSVTQLLHA